MSTGTGTPYFPEGWNPAGYFPPGYWPGVFVEGAPQIGGLRDYAAFEAIEAIFAEDLDFGDITFGGPYRTAKQTNKRGPSLHLRRRDFKNVADSNPTYQVRTVRFEATITWRGRNRDNVEREISLVEGVAEAGLTGQSLGFCIPFETKFTGGIFIDEEWPLVRQQLFGQFMYMWDTKYGRAPEPFVPPALSPSDVFSTEGVRLNLLRYLRTCQTLAPYEATVAGWEGEPYPWFPPRLEELPNLAVQPCRGPAKWLYEDAHEHRVDYDLVLATRSTAASAFTDFYGAVYSALFPVPGHPDRPARDACFDGAQVTGGGRGEMVMQPSDAKQLGYDPYGLIGMARVHFNIITPAG